MERILVLGSQGFIGRNLTQELKQKKFSVYGYDKISLELVVEHEKPKYIHGDFTNEHDFECILTKNKIDTIYHLISTTIPSESTDNIIDEIKDNVFPTIRLLDTLRKLSNIKLIFISSGGTVYGESLCYPHKPDDRLHPICSYGIQKSLIENYINLYNNFYDISYNIVRISNAYGVELQKEKMQGIIPIFINKLICNEPITLYGDSKRDYIYIDDVIEALIKIGDYTGEKKAFNVGSGVSFSTSQVIKMIEDAIGKQFQDIIKLPKRACDVNENVLDITETINELDWNPEYNMKAGIDDLISKLALQPPC